MQENALWVLEHIGEILRIAPFLILATSAALSPLERAKTDPLFVVLAPKKMISSTSNQDQKRILKPPISLTDGNVCDEIRLALGDWVAHLSDEARIRGQKDGTWRIENIGRKMDFIIEIAGGEWRIEKKVRHLYSRNYYELLDHREIIDNKVLRDTDKEPCVSNVYLPNWIVLVISLQIQEMFGCSQSVALKMAVLLGSSIYRHRYSSTIQEMNKAIVEKSLFESGVIGDDFICNRLIAGTINRNQLWPGPRYKKTFRIPTWAQQETERHAVHIGVSHSELYVICIILALMTVDKQDIRKRAHTEFEVFNRYITERKAILLAL